MTKRNVLTWEIIGIFVIFFLGSAWHFIFEWSGYWTPLAVIAPVNESLWEHFKLGIWPGLIFALIEFIFIRKSVKNFWAAKGFGLLAIPVVIGSFFFLTLAVFGDHFLIADISYFLAAVIICQIISYRMMTADQITSVLRITGIVILVLLLLSSSLLTFFPPHTVLFQDDNTMQYGILDKY